MKKALAVIATATALIISGCTMQAAAPPAAEPPSSPASEVQSSEPAKSESQANEETPVEASEEPMSGMTLNEYDGLTISAAVLPRKAILPGSVFPVTVVISNEGDKTISYIQGSSSYETPNALITEFDGLQPIVPEDRLGIATSDFGVKRLEPGETLKFIINVLAAEPDGQFDIMTHDLYNSEQLYIADLEWADLTDRYPELAAAKSGSYTGNVSFQYSVVSGDDALALFGEPTGYAQAAVTVGVTGADMLAAVARHTS